MGYRVRVRFGVGVRVRVRLRVHLRERAQVVAKGPPLEERPEVRLGYRYG